MSTGYDSDSEWARKGAPFRDKSALEEFRITQQELATCGSGWPTEAQGGSTRQEAAPRRVFELKDRRAKAELAEINRELRKLRTQIAALEARKAKRKGGG